MTCSRLPAAEPDVEQGAGGQDEEAGGGQEALAFLAEGALVLLGVGGVVAEGEFGPCGFREVGSVFAYEGVVLDLIEEDDAVVARGRLVPGTFLPIATMDGSRGLRPVFSAHGWWRQYDTVSVS
jgi:hypothetical protein